MTHAARWSRAQPARRRRRRGSRRRLRRRRCAALDGRIGRHLSRRRRRRDRGRRDRDCSRLPRGRRRRLPGQHGRGHERGRGHPLTRRPRLGEDSGLRVHTAHHDAQRRWRSVRGRLGPGGRGPGGCTRGRRRAFRRTRPRRRVLQRPPQGLGLERRRDVDRCGAVGARRGRCPRHRRRRHVGVPRLRLLPSTPQRRQRRRRTGARPQPLAFVRRRVMGDGDRPRA